MGSRAACPTYALRAYSPSGESGSVPDLRLRQPFLDALHQALLGGDFGLANHALYGPGVTAPVADDYHAIHPQQRRPADLAPAHALGQTPDGGQEQQQARQHEDQAGQEHQQRAC